MGLDLSPDVLDLSFVLGYADSMTLKFRVLAYNQDWLIAK